MSRRTTTVFTEALPSAGERLGAMLVVIEGIDVGRYHPIDDQEVIVGSASDVDVSLADDSVSARHLSVKRSEGRFVVSDLGSKNGVLYEGSLIREATVPLGATFKLGHTYVRIQPQLEPLEVEPSQSRRFGEMVAESLIMREVFAVLELVAPTDTTVLIEGETGTGKELVARAIHETSPRRRGPFVAVDCGALPDTLLESELFGHVRGAFTGAARDRSGAFVRAQGGTLLLDELGGIPAKVQARLLRVVEERRLRPLGSDREIDIDVRLVAASRHDLEAEVEAARFRPDLFYRLSVIRVSLPPLRSRPEDIAPIVTELLRLRGLEAGPLEGSNLERLRAHSWPGNVRELRNVIDRAIALTPAAESFEALRVSLKSTPHETAGAPRSDLPFSEAKALVLRDFERRYLADALARHEGNISATARATGIDRKHLRTLLRRHALIDDPT